MTTLTNAKTLEQAEYRIRTELGVSPSGYTHTETNPIYGTGEGSGNSPMIWCFLSSVLFNCYDKVSCKATYCHPDRSDEFDIGMIGFVDDSNGQTNDFLCEETSATLPRLLLALQSNAQTWADLLGASGGALELSKCSCHVMAWKFSVQGDPVLFHVGPSMSQPIIVTDPMSQAHHAVEILSPYTAHKTLGHYKEPAGTQHAQYRQLLEKSDSSTAFMWKCEMTPLEASTYYYACNLPSVGYPLSCSSLSFQQLDKIQRKAMKIIVAKCGYNRNTKREILYGPLEYGGANFRHLYVQQGVGQVTSFMRHWRQRPTTGKVLRCALSWAQMTVGTSYSILHRVDTKLPNMEVKWLASLRTFLATISASLVLDDPGIPPLQRTFDRYIMDEILDSNQFTAAQIRRLNYCRLFLQAVTLADITQSNGCQLDNSKLCGQLSGFSSTTQYVRVNQERPSEAEWKLWRKANYLWSSVTGALYQPLGAWSHASRQQRNQHFAYLLSPSTLALRTHQGFQVHYLRRTAYIASTTYLPFSEMPDKAQPIEVSPTSSHDRWRVQPQQNSSYRPIPPLPIADTFDTFITHLPTWEADLLSHTIIITDPYTACDCLRDGFKAGSDGSVRYHSQGSFGWVLSTDIGERVATGMGPARGSCPTSYRAEACAMLSVLRFLIRLAEYTDMFEQWTGVLVSDSESVLNTLHGKAPLAQATDTRNTVPPTAPIILDVLCPDWDVLIEIQMAMSRLPGVTMQFIKGHQDRTAAYLRLPLLAQLNVDADHMAGLYQDDHGNERPCVIMSPRAGVHLEFPSGTVLSHYARSLRRECTTEPLQRYLQHRNNWTQQTMKQINWAAHGEALKKQIKLRLHYSKLVHEVLPTNVMLNKYDAGRRVCPCCPHLSEDRDHVLRCPSTGRNKWRHKFLTDLQAFCHTHDTYVPLQTLLLDSLREWLYHDGLAPYAPRNQDFSEELQPLLLQQRKIGWRQLFNGRFSTEWASIQDGYYYRTRGAGTGHRKEASGHKWQTQLITFIWEKWYKLWKTRNQDVHGKDAITSAQADAREVRRSLDQICSQRLHMEPSVQALLCQDIRTHMQRPTWVTRNWINIHVPVFKASIQRARKRAIQGVRSIRTYFGTVGGT
jgi:hypothetical protein